MRAKILKYTGRAGALAICLVLLGFAHPFYLSVADLRYNAAHKRVEGSVRIFTNDFEAALKKRHQRAVDLMRVKDTTGTRALIEKYLRECFLMEVNGTRLQYQVLGFENEEEATWVYIESSACARPVSATFHNSVLYNVFKGQMNIVHFELEGKRQSAKVTNPEKTLNFNF